MDVMQGIVTMVSGITVLAVAALLIFGQQIFVLLAMREIRLLAREIPAKGREAWINEAMTSFGKGLEKASRS